VRLQSLIGVLRPLYGVTSTSRPAERSLSKIWRAPIVSVEPGFLSATSLLLTSTSLFVSYLIFFTIFLHRLTSSPRLAEIFKHGNWDLSFINTLDANNGEIKSLYEDLKAAAPLSKAASTSKTYAGPWSRFREWCDSKRVPHLPASPVVVALYMMKLLQTASSPDPILSFSGAVFLHHTMAGYASPTKHHLVRMACETAKRVRPAGLNKKNPFLASHIRRIISAWGGPTANLHQLMMAATIVLGFTTFQYSHIAARQSSSDLRSFLDMLLIWRQNAPFLFPTHPTHVIVCLHASAAMFICFGFVLLELMCRCAAWVSFIVLSSDLRVFRDRSIARACPFIGR
jgi:hypothetical protein